MKALIATLGVIAGATVRLAAIDVSLSAEIRLGKALPPPPPEVIVVEDSGPKGPPPWAPAHGFRRNRDYYYYPSSNVYYRPSDRTWFYLEGRDWKVGVNLPTSVRVDFDRSVSLTMETDRPFEFHDKVATYYPSNYFTKKVKIKERGGKPDKDERGHAAESHTQSDRGEDKPGKGQGKGKGKNK